MFDPNMPGTSFKGSVEQAAWFQSEPIWITAERSGIKTAVSSWPGE